MKKIIRSICLYSKEPNIETEKKLHNLEKKMSDNGFIIQTKRICSPQNSFWKLKNMIQDPSILLSIWSLNIEQAKEKIDEYINVWTVAFNLNLTNENISEEHIEILLQIIQAKASTFLFTHTFNVPPSSAYFPSANYEKDGFSIGLQPTDLAEWCHSIDEWLNNMKQTWQEICSLLADESDFFGIDSSVAPLYEGTSSLVYFINQLHGTFDNSIVTDTYLKITQFLKTENPKPIGLCGLMFPCLEDFELANEYEKWNFSLERNIFLSLHSGLWVDTYPIGIDESKEKIINALRTVQWLSNKYKKPLSVRFVSDGKAKIWEKTDFKNQYLKDIVVRAL